MSRTLAIQFETVGTLYEAGADDLIAEDGVSPVRSEAILDGS